MTYSLIEIKQRYRIPGPLSSNIDHALEMYHLQIRDGFYRAWSKHSCDVSLLFFFQKFNLVNFLEHISIIFEILHHFHTQKKLFRGGFLTFSFYRRVDVVGFWLLMEA